MQSRKCVITGCTDIGGPRGMCRKHYKRWQRHGHTEQTRPLDWGRKDKHPLHNLWLYIRRHRREKVVPEWLEDFWSMVKIVGERPINSRLTPRNRKLPLGPGNWYWEIYTPMPRTKTRESHLSEMRRRQKERRANDPDYARNYSLLKNYGVTLEEYNQKLEEQGHVCAICGQKEVYIIKGKTIRLAVDHKPGTKQTRGLLCASCNRGLGHFQDNPEFLEAAAKYLRRYAKKSKSRIQGISESDRNLNDLAY